MKIILFALAMLTVSTYLLYSQDAYGQNPSKQRSLEEILAPVRPYSPVATVEISENQSNLNRSSTSTELISFFLHFLASQLPYIVLYVGGFTLYELAKNKFIKNFGLLMIVMATLATMGNGFSGDATKLPYPFYSGLLISLPFMILIGFLSKRRKRLSVK